MDKRAENITHVSPKKQISSALTERYGNEVILRLKQKAMEWMMKQVPKFSKVFRWCSIHAQVLNTCSGAQYLRWCLLSTLVLKICASVQYLRCCFGDCEGNFSSTRALQIPGN